MTVATQLAKVKTAVQTAVSLLRIAWETSPTLLIGCVITFALPSFFTLFNIYVYKLIIDWLVLAVSQNQMSLQPIIGLLIMRFVSYLLQEISAKLQTYFEHILWLRLPIVLSEKVFGKLAQLDIKHFEDAKFQELLKNFDETYRYRTLNLMSNILYSFQSLVQLVIACIAIAAVNGWLIFVILLMALIEFVYRLVKVEVDWAIWWGNSPERVKFNYVSQLLQDVKAIKEIKIFQLGNQLLHELMITQQKFSSQTQKAAAKNLVLNAGISTLTSITTIGIEVYIISQALLKKLTIGDIGFYTGVIAGFQNGMSGLLRNLSSAFESSLYVKSIFDLLETKPHILESANPVVVETKIAPKIEFVDVSFTYPGGSKPILDHFSMVINSGEKVAFVGENGAGKSTIIKLLARFYDVDSGDILIDGVSIKDLDLQSWHQHIGILFQDFNQYQYTARENILFGNIAAEASQSEIESAAKSSGAESVIHSLIKKYDQVLGKTFADGVDLSTGQWQKIALARSFYRNAPVLILDEPTASIDARAEAEIFASVEKLSTEKSVIIISHRFSTVRNADTIYVIENGRIIEGGTHHKLMSLKGKYAELFTLQAKGYQ